ncbi:esterase [Mycobacterium intermedium]|nr:esterase [Mycobacterium intermedium]
MGTLSAVNPTESTETAEYAPGRLADIYGHWSQPAVLLWHGMQADARAAVGPLAGLLAQHGAVVVAPDWNSHADDGGRGDLLGSVDFVRKRANGAIVLVGWSLGGAAAAGLTIDAASHDVAIAHTVCLAGAFMAPDPISGRSPADMLPSAPIGSPFTLLHGLSDEAVPSTASRDFAASLAQAGWQVKLVELAADHGSIAGADYDPVADRYGPGKGEETRRMAAEVSDHVAATLER